MSFLENIKKRAKEDKKTIVLPEALDARILEATDIILKEDIANIVLIGNKDEIIKKAKSFDLSKATFVDPNNFDEMDQYVDSLVELRKHKGLTKEDARKVLIEEPLYLGVMMVEEGLADGMVAGAANATGDVLRPSLQILSTAPGTKLVSTFFVMVVPNSDLGENGTFVFSDCGLVQNPDPSQLAAIAQSSATSFEQLVDKEPLVAMLSHSTKGSAAHPDVDKVVEATKILKEEAKNLKVDGELQLDAAIVPEVGKTKAPGSEVAGKANTLIFPDIDAGNIGYKLVQRLANAEAFGPVTQGIAKPVNDLSRGCSVNDIVGVTAITAVQSQYK